MQGFSSVEDLFAAKPPVSRLEELHFKRGHALLVAQAIPGSVTRDAVKAPTAAKTAPTAATKVAVPAYSFGVKRRRLLGPEVRTLLLCTSSRGFHPPHHIIPHHLRQPPTSSHQTHPTWFPPDPVHFLLAEPCPVPCHPALSPRPLSGSISPIHPVPPRPTPNPAYPVHSRPTAIHIFRR